MKIIQQKGSRTNRSFLAILTGSFQILSTSGVNLLIAPMLVFRFGAEALGVYGTILQLIGYSVILDFGLSTAITNLLSRQPKNIDNLISKKLFYNGKALLIFYNLLLAILFMFLAFNYKEIFNNRLSSVESTVIRNIFLGYSVFAISRSFFYTYQFLLVAYQFTHIVNIFSIITNISKLITILLFANGRNGFYILFFVIFFFDFLQFFLCYLFSPFVLSDFSIKSRNSIYDHGSILELISFGFKYWFVSTSSTVQNNSDVLLITYFYGPSISSSYYAIKMFPSFIGAFATKLIDSIYPSLAEFLGNETSQDTIINKILMLFRLYFYIVLFSAVILFCSLDVIINFWYQGNIQIQSSMLAAVIFVMIIQCISHFFGTVLLGTSKIYGWGTISVISVILSMFITIYFHESLPPSMMIFTIYFGSILQLTYIISRLFIILKLNMIHLFLQLLPTLFMVMVVLTVNLIVIKFNVFDWIIPDYLNLKIIALLIIYIFLGILYGWYIIMSLSERSLFLSIFRRKF